MWFVFRYIPHCKRFQLEGAGGIPISKSHSPPTRSNMKSITVEEGVTTDVKYIDTIPMTYQRDMTSVIFCSDRRTLYTADCSSIRSYTFHPSPEEFTCMFMTVPSLAVFPPGLHPLIITYLPKIDRPRRLVVFNESGHSINISNNVCDSDHASLLVTTGDCIYTVPTCSPDWDEETARAPVVEMGLRKKLSLKGEWLEELILPLLLTRPFGSKIHHLSMTSGAVDTWDAICFFCGGFGL